MSERAVLTHAGIRLVYWILNLIDRILEDFQFVVQTEELLLTT